jgi:aspartyl-tRNA(Asn)/glutamyl-tRNA(Gln) amidotransferase subunit A
MSQTRETAPTSALLSRLRSGEIASVEATRLYLERIDRFDLRIGAFLTVDGESALAQAQRADEAFAAGQLLGPLHGLPVALKDNIDTADLRTTVGSCFFADHTPRADAEVTARLRQAGAVLLGKVTLHEFAFGATNQNAHFGACRNPWDLSRVPGGSSGGSAAAVAAGFCAAALGTDTGGSVRIPASLTGVSGLRPSNGRVSTRGVFPTTWTFDTVGPIARAVCDLAPLLQALAGYDPDDPQSVEAPADPYPIDGHGLDGMRIAVPSNFFFDGIDPEVATHVRAAATILAQAGAEVEEIELAGAEDALESAGVMIRAEAFAIHRVRLFEQPDRFGDDVRRRLQECESITAAEYAEHRHRARQWSRSLANTFKSFELILSPSTGTTAPSASGEMIETTRHLARLTYPWSVAGLPALSVPCGFSDEGLPIGLQLAAPRFHEKSLIRAGAAYQRLTDWHAREPPLTSQEVV